MVVLQRGKRFWLQVNDMTVVCFTIVVEEIGNKFWDVFTPFSQRRNFNGDNIEPPIEVFAKAALLHFFV